jgi:hypothetical protein
MRTQPFLYLVVLARQTSLSRLLPQMKETAALPSGKYSSQMHRDIPLPLVPQAGERAHDPNGAYSARKLASYAHKHV